MSIGEIVLFCLICYVWGAAIGVVGNDFDGAVRGLRDALTRMSRTVVDGWRGLWSWRP